MVTRASSRASIATDLEEESSLSSRKKRSTSTALHEEEDPLKKRPNRAPFREGAGTPALAMPAAVQRLRPHCGSFFFDIPPSMQHALLETGIAVLCIQVRSRAPLFLDESIRTKEILLKTEGFRGSESKPS
jgi:hypothetical protein